MDYAQAYADWSEKLVAKFRECVPYDRWGNFSDGMMAATLAKRAREEWSAWGRLFLQEPSPSLFFGGCARATRSCFSSAAASPRVECVQVAAYRRIFEPAQIGRDWFRAQLWIELDRMLGEGLGAIEKELLTWLRPTNNSTRPALYWSRSGELSAPAEARPRSSRVGSRSRW